LRTAATRLLDDVGGRLHGALLKRFIEEIDPNADVAALPDFVREDVVLPDDILPAGRQGRDGLAEHMLWLPTIIEHHSTVEDLVCDGDRVAARITVRGTHVGDFLGIEATGAEWEMQEMMIAHFRDGRISRIWRVGDIFSLVQQLGGAPAAIAAAG
jgi:predicted ester cyclase